MPVLLPILMIAAIFMVIRTHSALFPIKKPDKSAAVRYGESFKELLDGIDCCPEKKDKKGGG